MMRTTVFKWVIPSVAALLAVACAGAPPRQPAPVETPGEQPERVVKAYPLQQRPEFLGKELEGVVAPEDATEGVVLGARKDGSPVYLSDYAGKVLVVNYWASRCPPCSSELQQLEEIREEYVRRDIAIVAVNRGDSQSAIDAFLGQQQRPLRITVLSDVSTRASLEQGVAAVPTTLVFDTRGRVVRRYVGSFGFSASRIRGDIEQLLNSRG